MAQVLFAQACFDVLVSAGLSSSFTLSWRLTQNDARTVRIILVATTERFSDSNVPRFFFMPRYWVKGEALVRLEFVQIAPY